MTPTVGSYLDSYLHDLERLFQAGERRPLATPGMRALVERQAEIVTGRAA